MHYRGNQQFFSSFFWNVIQRIVLLQILPTALVAHLAHSHLFLIIPNFTAADGELRADIAEDLATYSTMVLTTVEGIKLFVALEAVSHWFVLYPAVPVAERGPEYFPHLLLHINYRRITIYYVKIVVVCRLVYQHPRLLLLDGLSTRQTNEVLWHNNLRLLIKRYE